MQLISLRLCNFRQFYGETPELVLTHGDGRKVTVIHGNNGAGKTTLLNALTWVLHEKFTAAFSSPESLVNKRAIAQAPMGQAVSCWVELIFEHRSERYQLRRECRGYRSETGSSEGKSELRMLRVGDDGRWQIVPSAPEDVIGKILPSSLHQYFFFDGERIEQIVRSNRKTEIAEATKILLGLEACIRAVRHLNEARKTLERELGTIGDPETQKLLREKNTLEKEIEAALQRQEAIGKEVEAFERLQEEVSQQLRQLEAVQEVQRRRDTLEAQQKREREKLQQHKEALKLAISTQGYTVLLDDVTAHFRELVGGLRKRGELPANIKHQFVMDLLERQRCICGTVLCEGEEAHRLVRAYLERAGLADVEEAVIRMEAQVDGLSRQVPGFWETVDQEQLAIQQLREAIAVIERELDDIHTRLKNNPQEDIRKLEEQLANHKTKIRDLTLEQGESRNQVKERKALLEKLSQQIEKHQTNEARQALAQRRIAATEDAIARIKDLMGRVDLVFRGQLERRVQEIFGQIVVVPYVPKLTERYELTLVESTTGQESPVAASTGEHQVLSLSFIAAIIDRVRSWSKKEEGETWVGPDSGTFPMVMDSPFGSLDRTYRRQVARALPTLANQLVVMASPTQWLGEVAEAMAPYVGKQYVLSYNSPKDEVLADYLTLEGERYALVKPSPDGSEYTEILEV